MKIKPLAIAAFFTLLITALSLQAQDQYSGASDTMINGTGPVFNSIAGYAPISIAGDSFFISNDDTNSASYGLLVVDNTGSNYTLLPIFNNDTESGTISYSNTGPSTAQMMLDAVSRGKMEQVTLTFSNFDVGTFVYTNLTDSNGDTGEFILSQGTAPANLAGMTLSCAVLNGEDPFAPYGTFNVYYSGSGTSYMIIGTGGVVDSDGTCSFVGANRSTLSVPVNDSIAGMANAYLCFSNSTSGILAIAQTNSGGFQIDTFTITNSLPPFYANAVNLTNQSWYWMSNGSNNLYGYFSTAYLPYIFHADLGWEYYLDAADGSSGGYFYDFTDNAWFYSNPTTFPYLYDFNANSWMWYEPSTNANHYTSNPKWLYNFSTTNWVNNL